MYQRVQLATSAVRRIPDAVIIAACQGEALAKGYLSLDRKCGGALSAAVDRPEFAGDAGQVATLYPAKGPPRVMLVGLGPREELGAAQLRQAGAAVVGKAFAAEARLVQWQIKPALQAGVRSHDAGQAIGEGMAIGNLAFDEYHGSGGNGSNSAKRLSASVQVDAPLREGFKRGLCVGESVNLARQLGATPPNIANPSYLARTCRKLAGGSGLKCSVITAAQMKKLGMQGLLAVGAAGSTPPALICLEWPGRRGAGSPKRKSRAAASGRAPIMLVGKAVTFDTGGYSMKPAAGMVGMKYDKCGGMAVIGAMHAIAQLKLPSRVVALIPAAENMVDERAYRPNDILTLYNGVTVEVTNTDAEGRLILADALAYGCKTYMPRAVIDLATLTGGVVVALGSASAGAWVNDADLREHLFDAAEGTDERLWHLPLWKEHKKLIKGTHSDIVNSAPVREAHAIQGAAFLSYFVAKDGDFKRNDPVPWAHLDIAGVAETKGGDPLSLPKGPTGFGVRLLVRAIESWPNS